VVFWVFVPVRLDVPEPFGYAQFEVRERGGPRPGYLSRGLPGEPIRPFIPRDVYMSLDPYYIGGSALPEDVYQGLLDRLGRSLSGPRS
jgi:hypothetical protein